MKFAQLKDKFKEAPLLRNKYVLASGIFIIWVGFVDENSILDRINLEKDLKKLKEDKAYYQNKIEQDSYEMDELDKNLNLEVIAREKYLMKKDDEEIFIIEKQ